jgi:argininosuccinate lyase
MMHLSRLAEEIILWSSAEFDFVEIDDAYATGSSIMPQKKNPDVAELVRGKTGRVYGNLIAILATMKALPLAYNRDLQEDKEALFDTVDTLLSSLVVFSGLIKSLRIKAASMEPTAKNDYILATDLADYLAKKGETFRSAHGIIAKLVTYAIENKKLLGGLSLKEYQLFSPLFDDTIYKVTALTSVAARKGVGGTASEQVEQALVRAKEIIREPGV